MLCKYRDVFGKPNTGFHSIRLLDVAILDVIGTLLIAWATSALFNAPLWLTIFLWFAIAVFMHRIFCVNTTINKIIYGEI